ncbi:MAG: ATP-dependent Clp protease proteolytic subunit [Xanthomonadales bacterium]|nr:ATP-dependent Clp protease proteolytic subunit [Xanthomonadales bacterium]
MNARLVAAFFGSALSILGGITFANSNNIKPTVARSFVEHNKSYLLTGPITPSTVREARMVFSTIDSSSFGPQVYLNSPGGDVNSAIEIGRLLRSKRATAHVLECASACVLVFAGASNRTRIRFKRTGNGYDVMDVIIHRPYFASAAANPNQEETQSRFSALRSTVRDYLLEMNVSPALWDAMVGISPSDARALTEQEIIDYGLVDTDPVEEEIVRQETSNRWQIPPQEVLRRESLGEKFATPAF